MPLIVPHLTGSPLATNWIRTLEAQAAHVSRPTTRYLTAGEWGKVAAELDAQYGDALMDPTRPAPWHSQQRFLVGKLLVVNSGTDDRAEVNRRNREEPGAIDYKERVERFRITADEHERIWGRIDKAGGKANAER